MEPVKAVGEGIEGATPVAGAMLSGGGGAAGGAGRASGKSREGPSGGLILECPPGSCVKFAVHDVEPSKDRKPETAPQWLALDGAGGSQILGTSDLNPFTDWPAVMSVGDSPNLLAASIYSSFYDHLPLKLNPNVVWIAIGQGYAKYLSFFSEALRHKFVSHEGKKNIEVERLVELQEVRWDDVIPEFAAKIEAVIGKEAASLLLCDFSNTTPVDRITSQILLMDAMQKYFSYSLRGGCGFPSIELAGTVDDWKAVRDRAAKLREFAAPEGAVGEVSIPDGIHPGRAAAIRAFAPKPSPGLLNAWLDDLLPVLDEFVNAAEGKPDIEFWGSLCNLFGGSGSIGQPLTGWITVFFPYFKNSESASVGLWRKAYAACKAGGVIQTKAACEAAVGKDYSSHKIVVAADGTEVPLAAFSLWDLPQAFSSAPVKWTHIGTGATADLTFLGGLATVNQNPVDGTLEARTGWVILKKPA